MSLPDGAEYWWDVRTASQRHRNKHVYTHRKGAECGHYHVYETKKTKYVDCPACIEILKTTIPNYEEIMNPPVPEPIYGRCSCGNARVKRTNRETKREFLGCSQYPKCKITSSS